MAAFVPSNELVARAQRGDIPAVARLISRVEENMAEARAALLQIYQRAGRAHVIGITGVPGSGKSTLVAALTARFRAADMKVGIVAIDPSSPYSGGAILGDRIRMSDLAHDAGVYIRSMATHGVLGGMARSTLDAVDVLDVGGFEVIIIETVGVGQDEVDIAKASHTTIVVSSPGLGDEIQAIKAGMLEIADIHVVSKCDRSDANRTLTDLKQMLSLGASTPRDTDWRVPVVGVSSFSGTGFDALVDAITKHRESGLHSDAGRRRLHSIGSFRLQAIAESLVLERFRLSARLLIPSLSDRLQRREADPYSLARELITACAE
jgi:LAO/AO transport system kinase